MPIGHSPQTAVWNKTNEVDVNTDDLQKLISSDGKDSSKQQTVAETKKPESKTPVQQIIHGQDQSAKKDLLKNFVQKVASKGMEIFASSEKGKKDTKSISDVKLLFGDDVFKADEVSISAEAKMDKLRSAIDEPLTSGKLEKDDQNESQGLEAREKFETSLFTEKTDARSEVKEMKEEKEDEEIESDAILDADGDMEPDKSNLLDQPQFDDEAYLINRNEREDGGKGDRRGDDSEKREPVEEMIEVQESEEEDQEVEDTVEDGVKKKYGEEDLEGDKEYKEIDSDQADSNKDLVVDDNFIETFRVSRDDTSSRDRGDRRGEDSKNPELVEEEMIEVNEVEEEDQNVEDKVEDGIKKKYGEEDLETETKDDEKDNDAIDSDGDLLIDDNMIETFRVSRDDTSSGDRGDKRGDDSEKGISAIDETESPEVIDDDDEQTDEDDHKEDSSIEKNAGGRIKAETSGGDSSDNSESNKSSDKNIEEKHEKIVVKEKQISKSELLEEYTDNYRKYLLNPKKKYFDLKQEEGILLKEFGITSRQLKDIQMTIRNNIKLEVRESVKDSILQKQLSVMNKFDSVSADAKLNQFTEYFTTNILMGGSDFGNFDDNFQGLVNKAMYLASKDLANFAIEELEDFVIEQSINADQSKAERIKSFETKVQDLNSITNNPKITEEWAQAAMEGFMKTYGLSKEEIDLRKSDTVGINVNLQAGTGDSNNKKDQRQKEKHGYEYDAEDERGIFINRLRALYLQKALNPGLMNSLDTEFKIRKLKNGLLKLGVYTEILNETVKEEANEIAKERLMEMLEEALQERASLYELRGSTYDLIESKIKVILKNGEKMGLKLDKKEFNKIRDKVNYEMFEVTKKEMEMIGVRLSDEDLPALVVKHREMKKLVDRLKEESGFKENVNGHLELSKITIAETA